VAVIATWTVRVATSRARLPGAFALIPVCPRTDVVLWTRIRRWARSGSSELVDRIGFGGQRIIPVE